jgi:hypothetical protein
MTYDPQWSEEQIKKVEEEGKDAYEINKISIIRPQIILEGIQVKSEEAFHRLCAALNEIEEQCGIMETDIVLKDIFFCPWIRVKKCKRTSMERLVIGIVKQMKTKGEK